jgi:hypothetical protein
VVYCHDVEFVSPKEVLGAVVELRRIRDGSDTLKYVGISGYPVSTLCKLAEMVLRETGEPLDAVMSYANYTLQNTKLYTEGVPRLKAAGVDVVLNASPLGMGLLRRDGVPVGGQGDFHPAPDGLRSACRKASQFCDAQGEKLEVVAIRYALENWLRDGGEVGSTGDPASGIPWRRGGNDEVGGRKLGVSVMGVSHLEELEETMRVWRSILDGLDVGRRNAAAAGRSMDDHDWSHARQRDIQRLAEGIRSVLGVWVDHAWASPGPNFVNLRSTSTTAGKDAHATKGNEAGARVPQSRSSEAAELVSRRRSRL